MKGRENVHKRYLIHVAGHNLGIPMRLLIGAGTPREAAARGRAFLFVKYRDDALAIVVLFLDEAGPGRRADIITTPHIVNGLSRSHYRICSVAGCQVS